MMLLTLDVRKNEFFGNRYYFAGIINGFAWRNGEKFFGIIHEKNRLHISAENAIEVIKELEKLKKSINRMISEGFLNEIIKKLKEENHAVY